MPEVLRFGIHSLDELLGTHSSRRGNPQTGEERSKRHGIYLLKRNVDRRRAGGGAEPTAAPITTSICIIGPSGTGKSIFGLHMASRYLADCIGDDPERRKLPAVLYVSTDLTYNMACMAWENFALNRPFARRDPFAPPDTTDAPPDGEIGLKQVVPTELAKKFDLVEDKQNRGKVLFVDMASYTAGDDWGFLHKLLSMLPEPVEGEPKHLVVADAIEGFEALAGEVNAFGEKSTRRSRVAQMMRLVEGKCHALLVVEKSGGRDRDDERLAEEFIADTVIRLENLSTRDYERRVLKVEKVRGQSHIRGHHHYSIRSGGGSTTGLQSNPDDPRVPAPAPLAVAPDSPPLVAPASPPDIAEASTQGEDARLQSYVQVFHSVHRVSRKIMEIRGKQKGTRGTGSQKKYAAFGITYLDNMLGGKDETTGSKEDNGTGLYYDTRGLPCTETTALIGDSLTQKSTLGKAFLSRSFHSFRDRLRERRALLTERGREGEVCARVREKIGLLCDPHARAKWDDCEESAKALVGREDWIGLCEHIGDAVRGKGMSFLSESEEEESSPPTWSDKELRTRLAAWTLDYKSGQAVMIATHNTHHERLARDFIGWLHTKEELDGLEKEMPGYKQALKNYIMGGTICRRLEIHSLSSEVLFHIVRQVVSAAQRKILKPAEMQEPDVRYANSWPIRVVIDDFSTLRDIFPELREDPLLLPSILFHFEREGVTTLIVDTQSGKPETPIAERFESELRQMVQHNLYTWRFPFYGESRVAITAIPPFSHEYAGIVRELRWESESPGQPLPPASNEPATVDPHFELYTGLEEGKPQPVPLTVRLYAETPAIESYIKTENSFLGELFVPARHPHAGETAVIVGVPPTDYNELRDFAYLQRDTRLDHTLVFAVDEFWALRLPDQRKRSGTSHSQWSYLNAVTSKERAGGGDVAGGYEPDVNVDPYKLFQPREGERKEPREGERKEPQQYQRRYFYEGYYNPADYSDYERFKTRENKEAYHIDRVPFTWDFGFLLCKEMAWKTSRHVRITVKKGKRKEYTVQEVWDSLTKAKAYETGDDARADGKGEKINYVSWRLFIEACKKAAEGLSDKLSKPVTAFDFAQISPESFSCLILEMWFSEIYDTLHRKMDEGTDEEKGEAGAELEDFLETISKRRLFSPMPGGKPSRVGGKEKRPVLLSVLLEKYWLELYKTWLLLIEVINFSDIVGEATALDFDFKSKNTDFSAIASRHWYKTAAQCPNEIAAKESLVAVRLPGHFSVRGDWFLAVSGSSRSVRQAERALDLLNSRRAHVSRLQLGLGLPTRFPGSSNSVKKLRTKLISHERGQDNVEYGTFLKLTPKNAGGAPDSPPQDSLPQNGFYWLWRSSMDDYVHCNRIWHKWLNRSLLSWYRNLLRYKSVWKNSFDIYDELTNKPPPGDIKAFAPTEDELNKKQKEWDSRKNAGQDPTDDVKKFLKKYNVDFLPQAKVRMSFRKLLEVLKEELKQATETTRDAQGGEDQSPRVDSPPHSPS